MTKIRYQVAASLDGYIAGPNHEIDWIFMDPDIDFAALFAQYDTFLMGRGTYEAATRMSQPMPGANTFVFSTTLRASAHPEVTIVPEATDEVMAEIRAQAEKDIWLFGGGRLFRSLLDAGHVDTVEIAVMPMLLGDGIPVIPHGNRVPLKLTDHRTYKTGIVMLVYQLANHYEALEV